MAIDMHQDAVELRPLYEMTGHALFNEVFLTDARAPADAAVGGVNSGWAVANTTLANERAGLGTGGGGAVATAVPGTIAGNLDRRAGDFVPAEPPSKKSSKTTDKDRPRRSAAQLHIDLAKGNGTADDPTIRQDLVRLHIMGGGRRLPGVCRRPPPPPGPPRPGRPNHSQGGAGAPPPPPPRRAALGARRKSHAPARPPPAARTDAPAGPCSRGW
ncbi:MAG: hypothetical protein M5U19_06560 [Microthrixaceae bacterium]|nr:hypothetical protein [Microthrixaceae bacterium]